MKVKKMLLLAGMSLAAIAFAAPTVAQAEIKFTDPNGTALGKGAKVTMTSTDLRITTAVGPFTCEKVTLHYEISATTSNHIVLNPVVVPPATHNGTFEKCHIITKDGVTTHAVHITNAGTGQITINTWGTGVAAFTSTFNITGVGHCTYTGNVHFVGKSPGTDEINIGPSALAGGLCGPGAIEGTGTLETPNGTPITVDFVKTD
jgi:hypothetical protein